MEDRWQWLSFERVRTFSFLIVCLRDPRVLAFYASVHWKKREIRARAVIILAWSTDTKGRTLGRAVLSREQPYSMARETSECSGHHGARSLGQLRKFESGVEFCRHAILVPFSAGCRCGDDFPGRQCLNAREKGGYVADQTLRWGGRRQARRSLWDSG